MLEQDACGRLSDVLNEAVDRFVIRYVTGDDEPLARIVVEPVSKPNVDTDIKIDTHLVSLGVKLSKNDALQRYGRTEADPNDAEDAALEQKVQSAEFGVPSAPRTSLFNEREQKKIGGESRSTKDGSIPLSTSTSSLLSAFAKDTGPAADAIKELLKNPSKEAAEALMKNIHGLLPDDPVLAAVIAEAMAKEFGTVQLANSGTSAGAHKGWETRRRNGWSPEKFAEEKAKVDSLVDELDKKSPDGKHPGWAHREESLGTLDSETIAAIKSASPDMDVDSSEMTVDTTQLQHAMNEHGVGRESDPGQVPITHEDLKRVPDVLSDYDEIVAGKGKKDGKHHNAVVFRKKYDDGTICCVEVDQYSEKRKGRILRFKTMWKEKIA